MGILNVTPDSFSDGGHFVRRTCKGADEPREASAKRGMRAGDSAKGQGIIDIDAAVAHAKDMVEQGADMIDIGGESSRPGSEPVSVDEELARVLPVIERLVADIDIPISIDTYKPTVADACVQAGASMINDISGLRDPEMIAVAAKHDVPVIIMHMQGEPKTMQEDPTYDDVVLDIKTFFGERIASARAGGVQEIIIDPGIGFGKTVTHNLEILRRLSEFESLGCPILVGTSRKSFIGNVTGAEVDDRLPGTTASNVIAVMNGANIIRVHDVAACKQATQIVDRICQSHT